MASQITNYKCPACTGPLRYDGATGRLKCDYCESEYTLKEIEALYAGDEAAAVSAAVEAAEAEAEASAEAAEIEDEGYDENSSYWDAAAEGLKMYNCPSCGAELIFDETTAATSCPYCGNPTIIPGQFAETLKPDLIIPFKLDKDTAVKQLKKFYKGKPLLPSAFSENNHIQEIKGVYVPFWLYDGEVDADLRFAATRVSTVTRGDKRITTTDHFQLRRAGTVSFENIPADASSKMPDEQMDSIEPFDYSELQPFSTAYLPGFMADRYDVSAEDCASRADERAKNTAVDIMRSTAVGYATCVEESRNLRLRRGKVKYALMPVWMLSTNWNGKNFLFTMNGQTGRLVGELPVSKARFMAWFAGIALPLMALLALFVR